MEQSLVLGALSAMAHETRLEIVRLLVPLGQAGMTAGEIAERVNASASRLSFHLSTLEQAGLVSAERDGRYQRYCVDYARMGQVIGYLLNDCCAAHPEVCACAKTGDKD